MRAGFAWVLAVGALLALSPLARADGPRQLVLAVAKTTEANAPALAMSLTFVGSSSGQTIVHLPAEWASEKELWSAFTNIAATNAIIAPVTEPQTRVLTHAPSAEITLRWTIVQDHAGEPTFLDPHTLFRPTLNDHVAIAAMQEILPSLELAPGDIIGLDPHTRTAPPPACDVSLSFSGFPQTWALATAFGSTAQQSAKDLRCDALWDSNLALGDFRVYEQNNGGSLLRLAIRGQWALTDTALLQKFAAAKAAVGGAFRDLGPQQFLVSLDATPPLPQGNAVFGTAFSYGFFGFATPNASERSLKVWWNHEQVHYWLPNRLGQIPEGQEAALAWFNEGFTDYFSLITAYRTHELDGKALADEMNQRFITGYLKSPVREAPNAKIAEGFWSNRDLQELPYQRGALLALNWNAEIKQVSQGQHSLADMLAALLDQARGDPNIMLTPGRIADAAHSLGVANASSDIATFIDSGKLLTPSANAFGPCATFDLVKNEVVTSAEGWSSAQCLTWLQ